VDHRRDLDDYLDTSATQTPGTLMPKKAAKLRPDVAETAFRVMQEATGQAPKTLPPGERTEKNPDAVARGRSGGRVGGRVRGAKMSKDQRVEAATRAANARWSKKKNS
jgi:hypothetical protein